MTKAMQKFVALLNYGWDAIKTTKEITFKDQRDRLTLKIDAMSEFNSVAIFCPNIYELWQKLKATSTNLLEQCFSTFFTCALNSPFINAPYAIPIMYNY